MDHDSQNPTDVPRTSPFRDLSSRQRAGLGVATLIVLVGLSWTVWSRITSDLVPLPTIEPLTATAVRELQATFRSAGSDRLPALGRSNPRASEIDSRSTPRSCLPTVATTDHWADEWERQNERLTPFSSHRDREANREIARARLITGMLQQLPDVQQADLVWDEEEQPGWRAAPKARATVYLQPKPDRVLTLDVIRSVRLAVAGSKKNLDPTDVVVMDLARQVTYEGALPASLGDELLPSLRSLAELYRREIQQRIPELHEAAVNVSVDLPRYFAFIAEHPHDAARRLSTAAPGLLRVAVTMPTGATATAGAESSVRRLLAEQIMALTGIGRPGVDGDRIVVTYDRPTLPTPPSQTMWSWPAWPRNRLIPPSDGRSYAAIFGGAALIGLALLIRHRNRTRMNSSHHSFPALHDVNKAAKPSDRPQRLLAFDDLTST